MVNLVEDWQDIERYTQQMEYWVKIGAYQLRKTTEVVQSEIRLHSHASPTSSFPHTEQTPKHKQPKLRHTTKKYSASNND